MKKILFLVAFLLLSFNSVDAAVVNGASLNGSTVTGENTLVEGGTHNGETIENEDCLKYPEKCKATIPEVDLKGDLDVPNLNSAGLSPEAVEVKKLPQTGPKEILLLLVSMFIAAGFFIVYKRKKV